MSIDIIDDIDLNENSLVINRFDVSKNQGFLVIKSRKQKVLSYIWTVLGCFLVGGFFLFITINYFLSDGFDLFLLLPFFMALFCIIPGVLILYAEISDKEKWVFAQNELYMTDVYGNRSETQKNEVSSIYIQEVSGNNFSHQYKHVSIHLKCNNNNKTLKLIQLQGNHDDSSDAYLLVNIISAHWDVPLRK